MGYFIPRWGKTHLFDFFLPFVGSVLPLGRPGGLPQLRQQPREARRDGGRWGGGRLRRRPPGAAALLQHPAEQAVQEQHGLRRRRLRLAVCER